MPWTATQDMAAAAVRLLMKADWNGQQQMSVIGPEDLPHNELATIISSVVGREVCYQQITFDKFKQQFLGRGASESFAQGCADMYRAKNEGMDNKAAHSADSRTATSFRQSCENTLQPILQV